MDWQHIYSIWLNDLRELDSRTDDLAPFEIVQLNVRELPAKVDWWPKPERAERLDNLRKGHGLYWETKKGTLHTAELLFANRGSIERQAAVLILASLDVKRKDLPEGWRGNNNRLMQEMFRAIREAFPEIQLWYHATRDALPVTIGSYFPACDFICTRKERELIYLFALEASLSLANWQLIRYVSAEVLGGKGK